MTDACIGNFYAVAADLGGIPLRDHLEHGYESRQEFRASVRELRDRWQGRVGECVAVRHGFLLLRFHDTPGGRPDEAWIPDYLLNPASRPGYVAEAVRDETAEAIDGAFGFD